MSDTPSETSGKAGLRSEIATPETDIFAAIWVDLLRPTDEVLEQQGGGKCLKIYDEIERDPLAQVMLLKRKLGLVARDWEIEPGGPRRADKQAAELCRRVLAGDWGLSFDKLCLDLLDATLKGYAVAELIWEPVDGYLIPVAIKPKDQRRFVFDKASRLRMLTRENTFSGVELPDRKFIVHRFGDKTGDPYGRGLGHQLFWWAFFKRMGVQFWMTFAEKFGSPTVVGEVPDTMLPAEEDVLLDKLAGIAQQTALTVPQGTVVKMLEALRSGTVTYPELVDYCDRMITVGISGETLTTSEGNAGSRALGQVHQEVRDEIVDADGDLLSATLNTQLMTWITELNYPDARPPRVWRPRPTKQEAEARTQQEQLKARQLALDYITAMRSKGWEPADPGADVMDQWSGGWTYTGVASGIGGGPPPSADTALPSPAQLAAPDRAQAVDHLAADLDAAAAPAMDKLIGQLRQLLDQVEAEGGDLTDVLGRLADLYPALDPSDLAQAIGQAMALGNLTGRLDVADGS